MIYDSILDLVGNTPMVRLTKLKNHYGLKSDVIVKLESFNPAGSAKDRVALKMIDDFEKSGLLKSGATIIEATSGNTGIGLGLVARARGYRLILTMPDTMSAERIAMLKAYGAEVVLTDGRDGMSGAVKRAEELHSEIEGSVIASQFGNISNPNAHYETTAVEIYGDTRGDIDYFIAGVGTGGTISGVGKYLKEKDKSIKVVAVEPSSSAVLSGGQSGMHKIQGIGAGFVPDTLDMSVVDEIYAVSDEDAYMTTKALMEIEGIFAGISSGAALHTAISIAREVADKQIVVILPDSGDRYLSLGLYD